MITRLCAGLASRFRVAAFRARGMDIRGRVRLGAIDVRGPAACVRLEDGAALDHGVTLVATSNRARIALGARTYVNRHTIIDADETLEIGADSMIGPFCYLTDHDHAFARDAVPAAGALVSRPTRIGARCWLGAHVTVLKGVTIGDGTVVGAGSVVTKSLPPSVVAVGNPARVLREIAP